MRRISIALLLACTLGTTAVATAVLPSLWALSPPEGAVGTTGTFPQGIALSPDGTKLAVVEAGFNPPALRVLDANTLQTVRLTKLKDAFGVPAWDGNGRVLVAGGSTDALLAVDLATGTVSQQANAGNWTAAIARAASGDVVTAGDVDGSVHLFGAGAGTSAGMAGSHPSAIAIGAAAIYVANRGASTVTKIAAVRPAAGTPRSTIAVDLHPSALLLSADGSKLYVACGDADAVDVVDTATDAVVARIDVGLPQGAGASPNALALAPDGTLYVTLGAENAIAQISDGRVVARMPAGWYPSGIAADARYVYVTNGRGEGSRANPNFEPERPHPGGLEAVLASGYVAASMTGSVRRIERSAFGDTSTQEVLANVPAPEPTPAQTVVRAHGPIQHVIYVIKENRTYDQVLGDLAGADGDPQLAFFGEKVTPNEHEIARRFGIFDMTFTDAQVSASGHNWSMAAFANDYVERFWPPNYGGRRNLDDFIDGSVAATPRNGYLWDDAEAHGVSLRDYGEYATNPTPPPNSTKAAPGYTISSDLGPKPLPSAPVTTQMPGLKGKLDPHYPAFDLQIDDELRADEWQREFEGYVKSGTLPDLEIIWLPNDHTELTLPGALTPRAYAAQNDHAFGRIVDTVSHSPYWKSTAIFAIEDDAQLGPDHVDDQRTTFYLASPYAARGVHHARYSTSSVLHTIELLLGLAPMSVYDAVAPPIYDAFATTPSLAPFEAIPAQIDVTERNPKKGYGAQASLRTNFRAPDAGDPAVASDILAHAAAAHAGPR